MASRTLASKVTLSVSLMTSGLILGICILTSWYSIRNMEENTGTSLAGTTLHVSTQLDQFMWSRIQEIEILMAVDAITSGKDYNTSRKLLNSLKASFPSFSWIGLTDANGIVRAATDDILLDQDISMRPVFSEGRKGKFIGDVHEAVLLARYLPNPTGEDIKFVDISRAVYDSSGVFIGVLAAHLNWTWGKKIVQHIKALLPETTDIFVLSNKTGAVLIGPEAYLGKTLSLDILKAPDENTGTWMRQQWPDGNQYLTGIFHSDGYESYKGLDWIILIRQPVRTLYVEATHILLIILSCGIIFMAIAIFMTWYASRKIVMPLNELSKAADRLRFGEAVSIPKHMGIQEIESLEDTLSSLFTDLTAMENLAMTDTLTGLSTRCALTSYLRKRVAELQGTTQQLLVIFIDLDQFKQTNDTFGHAAGDALLAEISRRLKQELHLPPDRSMIGRIGGDEFIIALSESDEQALLRAKTLANAILTLLNLPVLIEGRNLPVGCSIGCALWPTDGTDITDVIDKADKALYYSKKHGKNSFTLYQDIKRDSDESPA